MANLLPDGFHDLERFLDYWDVPTSQERIDRRSTATWEQNREFYDAMTAHGDQAMDYFDQFDLDALPEDSARLYRLVLSLAHVAMAIEIHGRVIAPNAPYPNTIRIVDGAHPYG